MLSELKIKGLRSYSKEQKIEFSDKLTIITGKNG